MDTTSKLDPQAKASTLNESDNNSLFVKIRNTLSNQCEEINLTKASDAIAKFLEQAGNEERALRESTVTFGKTDTHLEATEFAKIMNEEWRKGQDRPAFNYWEDHSNYYIKFISPAEKSGFIDWLQRAKSTGQIRFALRPANEDGSHYKRQPIRLVLPRVRQKIKAVKIAETLCYMIKDGSYISAPKDGKPHAINQSRNITFLADSDAFKTLFMDYNGKVPYMNGNASMNTELHFRVDCRPFVCNDCYAVGKHKCTGKLCGICGKRNHTSKACRADYKHCARCGHKGHGATNANCPSRVWDIIRRLRKMDIPLEFYQVPEHRAQLAKSIIYK